MTILKLPKNLQPLCPAKGTTRGSNLLEGVMATIKRLGLSLSKLFWMTKLDAGLITSLPAPDPGSAAVWGSKRINPRPQSCLCLTGVDTPFKRRRRSKLSGITTDGAPSMIGRRQGLGNLLQLEANKVGNDSVMRFHCIIHQEKLCAKSLKMQNVMSIVIKTVNFICSKGLRYREFQELLHSIDADFQDISYYTEIRWLSRGKTLKRVFELKDAIQAFLKTTGNPIAEFNDEKCIENFAFLVDITTHVNELNSRLQRKGQLIHSMFDHVNAFAMKLTLWEKQMKNKNFVHFPTLQCRKVQNSNTQY